MRLIRIYLRQIKNNVIKRAAEVLKQGGVVVYPTDTAYGIAVDALNDDAVKKLYRIKGRESTKPTHIIVPNWSWFEVLTYPNETARKLYDGLLPGPLTIVLKKKQVVPNILTGGLPTLGIRIPDYNVTRLISKYFNAPYTTPSANKSGVKTPYSVKDVMNELDVGKVDLILDAGKLPTTPPSTIVDLTGKRPKILREGPVNSKQIKSVVEK